VTSCRAPEARATSVTPESAAHGGGYARPYWNASAQRNRAKFWSSPYDGLASNIRLYLHDESGDYVADPPQEHPVNYHYYAGPLAPGSTRPMSAST
jgi:hypothetical protein